MVTPRTHEGTYLIWPNDNGGTSQSPASSWKTPARVGETVLQANLREVYEKLELPGVLMDYHFILSGGAQVLMRERHGASWVCEEVEKLCLLDVRLIECYPELITVANSKIGYLRVLSFESLIHLYEREGYLREAFAIAQTAARFNQQHAALDRIRARLTNLEAEAAHAVL